MSEEEGDDVVLDMAETASVTSKDEMITDKEDVDTELVPLSDMENGSPSEQGSPSKLPYIVSPRRRRFNRQTKSSSLERGASREWSSIHLKIKLLF